MRTSGWMGAVGAAAMLFLIAPVQACAQLPIDVWVRPLLAVPVGEFSSRDSGLGASARPGLDAGGAVALGRLAIYVEYQEVEFGCEECAEVELDARVLDRGWGAGVQLPLYSSVAGFRPWGRLGVMGHHLRFRFEEESAYSNRSLGWSAGVGAEARPLRWLRIEPALLVRSYDASFGFTLDVPDRDVSVTYVALGLGVGVGF